MNSEGTQQHIHMYPFSPKLPSHPACHKTLCRVACAIQKVLVGYPVYSFLKKIIYLTVPGLYCSMWDLVPQPGIESRPPALGAQSLSHWTTREFPPFGSYKKKMYFYLFAEIFWFCFPLFFSSRVCVLRHVRLQLHGL